MLKYYVAFFVLTANISAAYADWGPPQRLPEPPNSSDDDDFCHISDDGTELYFCSDRPPTPYYDIWYSRKAGTGWTTPVNLTSVNSYWPDHAPYLSGDERTLYFSSYRGEGGSDVYYSKRSGSEWGTPNPVPGEVNTVSYDEGDPVVTSDGLYLYFYRMISNNADIYVSRWTSNKWGTPSPIPALNSPQHDLPTFITDDGDEIYLASQRPGGYGGYDLYVSRKAGASWGRPANLGPNINSDLWEVGCSMWRGADTNYRLYIGKGPGGLADIYVSEKTEPLVVPTSWGKIKTIFH